MEIRAPKGQKYDRENAVILSLPCRAGLDAEKSSLTQKIDTAIKQFRNGGIHGELTRERLRAFVAVLRWAGMRIGGCRATEQKENRERLSSGLPRTGSAFQFLFILKSPPRSKQSRTEVRISSGPGMAP
jgi:hypothetical protein